MSRILCVSLCTAALLSLGLLSACGIETAPTLAASSPFVDFGEVPLGDTAEATLRIANTGNAATDIGQPSISGDDAAAFALVTTEWPMTLSAGAAAEIALSFTPTASGTWAAEIALSGALEGALSGGAGTSAAGNAALSVALVGHGGSAGDDDDTGGDDDDSVGDDDDDDDDTSGDDDTSAGPDADGDGFTALSAGGNDCDDGDPTVHPGAVELCDGIDNNCNGVIDGDNPGGALTFYLDADADGYGSAQVSITACEAPEGYVDNDDDCNDLVAHSYPGADEICDEADNDCDGNADEGVQLTWYQDADSDGYGSGSGTSAGCDAPPGYVDNDSDCNDADATINPSAYELCDTIDNDCDSSTDEDPINGSTWYLDADADGAGGSILTLQGCSAPSGYVDNSDDCDDLDPLVGPEADELCNSADDDCDGSIDEDATDGSTWYLDNDGDGVGGNWLTQQSCSLPTGYAPDSSDCDDTDATTYPAATELCDGADNDCDGALGGDELDGDGDGVTECDGDCDDADPLRFAGSAELCDGIDNDCNAVTVAGDGETDDDSDGALNCDDCNDTEPLVNPSATEVCNSVDDDCDGSVDVGASDTLTWYLDADGDGYGGGWLSQVACIAPTGYVSDSTDCNDLDPTSHPGGTELCDGQDNDCNGNIDDGMGLTWYADSDSDGYGDPGTMLSACSAPAGYVSNSLDCDDSDAATNPTNYEICDGVDNNCTGGIDEDTALDTTDWYLDADGDGYGVAGSTLSSCTQPSGYADNDLDCDDDPATGSLINPAQTENWYDGTDQDCNGGSDYDQDGDGHDSAAELSTGTDCDDTDGTLFTGCPLYDFPGHTFNSCSVTGQAGPTLAECLTEYSTSPWTSTVGYFNIITQGIQRWTVPASGIYRIEAIGAAGQSNPSSFTGGLGTSMRGDFTLSQGAILQILVGQMGGSNSQHGNENGGGGGSFVVDASDSPLVIAGGGGGAPSTSYGTSCGRNSGRSHAVTGTSGQNWSCQCNSSGGSGGSGGGSCSGSHQGAGGGGLTGDGSNGQTHCAQPRGGSAFTNGGVGGDGNSCYGPAYGGFGGGGGAGLAGPGGGGGYSGGASGGHWSGHSDYAGGGGSFNSGSNQTNAVQAGNSDGRVEITPLF